MRLFGSNSPNGTRFGVKNDATGLLGLKSVEDTSVCLLVIGFLDVAKAEGIKLMTSFVIGSRSPHATPVAVSGSMLSPINVNSSSFMPSVGGVSMTSFLATGQNTH